MGGKHFKNDDAFISTAVRDVKRLERLAGLNPKSRLLDWGCGAGRLAVGVREHYKEGRIEDYHGVDVQPDLISWARENLTAPGFRFTCVDVANERYNPAGLPDRTIAAEPSTVDVFYAYSVFSHMNDDDSAAYLKLIGEALSDTGKAFVTCFVEEGVPDWRKTPRVMDLWSGRVDFTARVLPAATSRPWSPRLGWRSIGSCTGKRPTARVCTFCENFSSGE